MGQLAAFSEYMPSFWLSEGGVLFEQVASSVKRFAATKVQDFAAIAAAVVVATTTISFAPDAVTAWPLTAIEQQQNAAIEAIKAKFARVDLKLAQFSTTDPSTVDLELLAEARLTVSAVKLRG